MRTALLLTLWAFSVTAFSRVLAAILPAIPAAMLGLLASCAGFGVSGALGLYVLDGRHEELIPRRVLGTSQILWYALLGVLAIAPVSLCQDVMLGILGIAPEAGGASMDAAAFLLVMIRSALLTPVLEEVFFRGYLQSVLARYGRGQAVAAVSLIFALMHGDLLILPHAAFGALLGLVVLRTDSILASMLVHGGYNLTILLLTYLGADGLFTGLSVFSCALRVGLSLAFVDVLRRAWTARVVRLKFDLPDVSGWKKGWMPLSLREALLLGGAAAAVLLSVVLTGVLV
ncbi:MAG: CPBP family intramembrane metalloprotease [Clostridia bacterium]|nr:CPBP family intramembrane metalloprotease [Clostridia bacterium]